MFVCDLRHVSHGPRARTRLAVGRQMPRGAYLHVSLHRDRHLPPHTAVIRLPDSQLAPAGVVLPFRYGRRVCLVCCAGLGSLALVNWVPAYCGHIAQFLPSAAHHRLLRGTVISAYLATYGLHRLLRSAAGTCRVRPTRGAHGMLVHLRRPCSAA